MRPADGAIVVSSLQQPRPSYGGAENVLELRNANYSGMDVLISSFYSLLSTLPCVTCGEVVKGAAAIPGRHPLC